MEKINLKYGEKSISFELDENKILDIISASEKNGLDDPLAEIEKSLDSPIGVPPLLSMLENKKPDKVVIVVNDVSRPTPYEYLLPPILAKLHTAGIKKDEITFLIATGIHDPNTKEQNEKIFGEELVDNYRFVSHNPDQNLVDRGELSSGNTFYVNKEIIEADFIITTGVILPHYFAGFSGGRKSILPGVAGRETIQYNHSRMVDLMGNLPPIDENPVSQEMIEAARKVNVDFIVNVVTNSKKEIVQVVAGDLVKAWREGVNTTSSMYNVSLKEKADVAFVSTGGYPRDINIYQAQKALDHADHAVKNGGTIILIAECRDGLGEKIFEDWMNSAQKPEDNITKIKEKFVIGGHKAFAISQVVTEKDFILISSLDKETTEKLFAQKMDVDEALSYVDNKYNGDYSAIIMPDGSLTVPVVD